MPGTSDKELARSQFVGGQRQAAAVSAQRAVDAAPGDAQAWTLLGLCLEALEPERALAAWQKAIALAPHDAEPHFRIGDFERRRGHYADAIGAYRVALAAGARHPVLLNNLGLALQEQGELDEATRCFSAAAQLQPDMAPAHANLGDALRAQHRITEAIAAYTRASALAPNVARLWLNLGVCQHRVDALADARASFERALALDPDAPDALVNLAASLNAESRYAESLPLLRKALALSPDHAQAQSALLYVQQQTCAWDDIDASIVRQRALLNRPGAPPVNPHNLLALPFTAAEQFAAARHWARQQLRAPAGALAPRTRRGEERLRIGYASTDFRAHPLANLLTEVIERHDRARVEVFAYSLGPDDGSAARARFERAFDHFADVRRESDEAIVQRVRDDRIAVLIDTNGYVLHARNDVFALRAAPVQINGIGFAATLGSNCYDFILTDSFVTPPDQQSFFSERFMLLPHCYLPADTRRVIDATPTRAQCGLPETGFVFCCFNASYKILPDVFAIWLRLLQRVAGSVLWLLETNREATANLREQARRQGLAAERLVFAARVPLAAHLARHALADLFLDTFPYNAHTTANDALFAGLPLVTCAGETFASRVAGSQLRAIGLPELVTHSLQAYEALALELAQRPALLAQVRARLSVNRGTQPLFDVAGYTRALEALFFRAWEEHQRGQGSDAVK
ncbi:MAG TPA: tetratricopeptide repeat protein [Casimicrobiaceae bacterium]|jgi:predicted O-linked N-acetylglucosamine transferase (SPINDLY family)|nr:tetratricopeptide repeat protein [Casimicrobiaceae bacterium]